MPSSTAARVAFNASSTRSFFSLHLDLGGTADLDHGDAAGELGEPLLQLLAVIVGGRVLDLLLDLGDARLDIGLLAAAIDDRGVILGDDHLLGAAEHVERYVLELDAEILGDDLAAGQNGDVLQHGLTAVAEAGRLDGSDLQAAAELVDHERGERLALDILRDHEKRLARLHDGLEQRQDRLQVRELLLVDENVGAFELDAHLVGVGDEIGGNVAAVELHALDHFELGLERLGLLDGDDAVIADLLHRLGDDAADVLVAVGGDGADLRDLFARGDFLRLRLQLVRGWH